MGTEFNVKQREQLLEVECYEGQVAIFHSGQPIDLKAGHSFRLLNGVSQTGNIDTQFPSWIEGVSSFTSVPFAQVLTEFERQYDITLVTEIDTDMLFTGSFVHHDMALALKTITMPFKLNYSENNNQITLYY